MSIEVERNIDMGFKMANILINGPTVFLDVINALMEYYDKDPAVKTLNNYMKQGGNLEFTACKPQYKDEFNERLKDAGITFMETKNLANGGVHLFVYAEADRDKINKIINEMRADYELDGITDHVTMSAYAKGNVRQITGLSTEEAMVFAEHAEKRGIKIVVDEPLKDQFKITYAAKDYEIVNRIKADVAIELSGVAGQALRRQLNWEDKKMVQYLDMVKNYSNTEPAYLVDLKGNELKIEENMVTYKEKDIVITVEKNEPEFKERVDELILQMKGPVFLNEEKKLEYDSLIDKRKLLIKEEIGNGRPQYTDQEYAAIREMNLKKELIELKLAMAQPDPIKYDICIENDDMRLATFEEFNDINTDIEDGPLSEEYLQEIKDRFNKMQDSPVQMDYELIDIEDKVLNGYEINMEYDNEIFDLQHDKNNNLKPDEWEV